MTRTRVKIDPGHRRDLPAGRVNYKKNGSPLRVGRQLPECSGRCFSEAGVSRLNRSL